MFKLFFFSKPHCENQLFYLTIFFFFISLSLSLSQSQSLKAMRYLLIELEELVGQKYCGCCALVCCQQSKGRLTTTTTWLSFCGCGGRGGRGGSGGRRKSVRSVPVNRWCHPTKWRWRWYFGHTWNLVDTMSSLLILVFCSLQISVHWLKAKVNTGSLSVDVNQWHTIIRATTTAATADDILALGFFFWGLKLFKIIQLVPVKAGRIFEAIGGTLVADRVVVLLAFLFLVILIFSLSFFMMYSGDDSVSYGTIFSSIFATYRNMLGDSDYASQKDSNFLLGQFLWFLCVLTLSM